MALAVLLAVVLAASPETARYVFELEQVPVGIVELSINGSSYSYRSTQWFRRGADRSSRERIARITLSAADAARPLSLWLWQEPARIGCIEVREELGVRRGPACVTLIIGDERRGTVLSEPFRAHYRNGRLDHLELGTAHFTATGATSLGKAPPDLFSAGVPISGDSGALDTAPPITLGALVPDTWTIDEARSLARDVHRSFDVRRESHADLEPDDSARVGSCLAHARRFAQRAARLGRRATIVLGVVAEPGSSTADPHAWVRVQLAGGRSFDLDPTLDIPVGPTTHLALAYAADPAAGDAMLRAFTGATRVFRRPVTRKE